jgi:uncharacterized repeat protein (TIGR03847 family)
VTSSFDVHPERFGPGAVGRPGSRVFYIQAVSGDRVVTLRLEKQQVAALAEYLAGILADLPSITEPLPPEHRLVEPVIAEWVVGSLGVAYDEGDDRILIVAEELVPEPDEPGSEEEVPDEDRPEPATARFHLTRRQVAAFIRDGAQLVVAGRPACPICGRPMDPDGHVCPRSNGQRRS